jgi:hypothetical protein
MDFCTKPPNFGVEAHMEAPAGVALIVSVLTKKNAGDPSEPEHKTGIGLAAS